MAFCFSDFNLSLLVLQNISFFARLFWSFQLMLSPNLVFWCPFTQNQHHLSKTIKERHTSKRKENRRLYISLLCCECMGFCFSDFNLSLLVLQNISFFARLFWSFQLMLSPNLVFWCPFTQNQHHLSKTIKERHTSKRI